MNCRECEHNIPAMLDHEISAAEAARLREHLRTCRPCARLCQELQQVEDIFSQIPDAEPNPTLWTNIAAHLSSESGRRPMPSPPWSVWSIGRAPLFAGAARPWLAALAVTTVMVGSAAIGWHQHRGHQTQRQLLAQIDRAQQEMVRGVDSNPFAALADHKTDENPFREDSQEDNNPFRQP